MMTRQAVVRNRALAARVKRYHTWPVLHQETIGEHTFRVLFIYREIFGTPRNWHLIEYIMDHDMTEIATGDLPFPIKSKNPLLKREIDRIEDEHAVVMKLPDSYDVGIRCIVRVKVCDLLQMWEFGKIESRMGNMLAMPIIGDTAQAVMTIINGADFHPEDRDAVMNWMKENEL